MKLSRSLVAAFALVICGCGGDDLPSRDQIPVLRQRVYALEQGIRSHNRAGIDSLLSVDILELKEDSDSLLRFVYGGSDRFQFKRLGDYTIFFNKDIGVVDCFIMDSTQNRDRPLRLKYKLDDKVWLLTEFGAGPPDSAKL